MPRGASQLLALPCEEPSPDVLRGDPTWQGWSRQLGPVLILAMLEHASLLRRLCAPSKGDCAKLLSLMGCKAIPYWVEAFKNASGGVMVDPCVGSWMGSNAELTRPLAPACPVTCRCREDPDQMSPSGSKVCPGTCALRGVTPGTGTNASTNTSTNDTL
mmetsp:Transcript_40645/g.108421  ORF Transcript_40645/g.108421 Transcript_40645/m.108421 type:complete len:159 (-) Transcript_40645:79-555(-)